MIIRTSCLRSWNKGFSVKKNGLDGLLNDVYPWLNYLL